MAVVAARTSAVAPESLVEIPFVNPSQFFKVTLQFGSMASWRNYSGQPRLARLSSTEPGKNEYVHNPLVHEDCGPYSGKVVNGLIQSHNEWVQAFRAKRPDSNKGHLDRQIMVLRTEQTADLPAQSTVGGEMLSVIDALVQRAMATKSAAKA